MSMRLLGRALIGKDNWKSNGDSIESRPASGPRRNSHRGADVCLVKTAARMNRCALVRFSNSFVK